MRTMHAPVSALVSDQHLRGPEDPAQLRFLAWLRTLEADRLFVLGDLFDFYWEEPTADQEPVVAALEAFEGELVVLAGNHDFALGRRLGRFAAPSWRGELAGVDTLLVHGDEADRSLGYRTLKAVVRSPAVLAAGRWTGAAGWVGKRASSTSRVHGIRPGLLDAQRAWAAQQDAARVVMGHSHQQTMEPSFVVLGTDTWLRAAKTLEFRRL
jgi:UDP-2,3-diacylglucosamine pyrophosphatase LpxH